MLDQRGRQSRNPQEKLEMLAVKVMAGGQPGDILREFGIDGKRIKFESEKHLGKQISRPDPSQTQNQANQQNKKVQGLVVTENPFATDLGNMSAAAATDFFANLGQQQEKPQQQQAAPKPEPRQQESSMTTAGQQEDFLVEQVQKNQNWNAGAEAFIKKNLMMGNYQYAAEIAMKCGR